MPSSHAGPKAPIITIKTSADYRRTWQRIRELEGARPGSVRSLERKILRLAAREYEPPSKPVRPL